MKQAFLPAPTNVIGEWRVMGIDGEPVNENYAIAFSIDADGFQITPPCVYSWAWSYEYAGGRIALDPAPPPPAIIPLPKCDETQEKLAAALNAVTDVKRTRENGVLLSGSGHSLLLFSQ